MKTAEEILEKNATSTIAWITDEDEYFKKEEVLSSMEQYADQFTIDLPSDDEIKSMTLDLDSPTPNEEEYTTNGFRAGVMWLRNRILKQMKRHNNTDTNTHVQPTH